MKKILVIEDDPKHLQDAKDFFSKIDGVEVTYQTSYEPFNDLTRHNTPELSDSFEYYDGVISDIYFPEMSGKETYPIGVSVMVQCKVLNVPCVLCTSGYHHGEHYQWICDMQRDLERAGWDIPSMVDSCHVDGDSTETEGPEGKVVSSKGWERAWKVLKTLFH